jgi:hypothetical protein
MAAPAAAPRLVEVVAALSSVSDLTRGHPTDEAQRACLVALALARGAGIEGPALHDVYYTALLRSVGCTATSHELAGLAGGDDVGVRRRGDMIDPTDPRQGMGMLLALGGPRLLVRAAPRVAKVAAEGARADCGCRTRSAAPSTTASSAGTGAATRRAPPARRSRCRPGCRPSPTRW